MGLMRSRGKSVTPGKGVYRVQRWVLQGMMDDPVTVEQFCRRYVEPMGEESDHIHIVAITDALQVRLYTGESKSTTVKRSALACALQVRSGLMPSSASCWPKR